MKVCNKCHWTVLFVSIMLLNFGCSDQNDRALIDEPGTLYGKNVAFLITEGFHDAETLFPMAYLINHGAKVTVIGEERGTYTAYNSDVTARVERAVTEVSVGEFDVLVIPGGRSPARLRENENVVSFVKDFVESNKPTAAICHGPQILVTAGVISGRSLTGTGGIEGEITGAGALFENVEVLVDGNIITSRNPGDLPAFTREIAVSMVQ